MLPGLDLLDEHELEGRTAADPAELERVQQILIETLGQFGIAVAPGDITKGPTITRYEVYPAKGVRVDKIVSLERDLARATRAERINILAPIPGKDTVGIELANPPQGHGHVARADAVDRLGRSEIEEPNSAGVRQGCLRQNDHCRSGSNAASARRRTTGSGKSVCINALIASMLSGFTPEELRFIMIDPKVVEMQVYNALPHLAFPVVTDPKKVLLALRWLIDEMERRYKMFARVGVRNIISFNGRPAKKTQKELDEEANNGGRSASDAGLAGSSPLRLKSRSRVMMNWSSRTKFPTSW